MSNPHSTQEAPGCSATQPAALRGFSGLRRRIYLTYRYLGWRSLLWRALTFPLRLTPLRRRLRLDSQAAAELRRARAWYQREGRPVSIVIATYGPPGHAIAAVASVGESVCDDMAWILVCDGASEPEHQRRLRQLERPNVKVILGETNRGFAGNVLRGLRAAAPDRDVVVLNSDVRACRGWLGALQYAAYAGEDTGIVGPKLLYPDDRIQFAGSHRNLEAPEWFDHRYRFKPAGYGPANVTYPVLAVTGACMYVRRAVIDRVGPIDDEYPMAYEDIDWCLRAWQAGFTVLYFPVAELEHLESVTRGTEVGARERASQERFWSRWGGFFDERQVRTASGKLRVVYVTEDTGVGGGHRDVFEHLTRLAARGHEVELFTLGSEPDWFDLRAPVRSFGDYDELAAALAPIDAIKVGTWWNTSEAVWRGSVLRGIPVYFVQDIETSYYPDSERARSYVLASYREEFAYMTISSWNQDRLRELGLHAELMAPGIDLDLFRRLPQVERRSDMLVGLGRSNPLKNLPLTISAWRGLRAPRPELCLFGIEPELAEPGIRYVEAPSDEGVNELYNQATVFVQTSVHEGFCLPALEAMAAGAPVVCTDAHGNRDFCRDGENCLMPEPSPTAVTAAVQRILDEPGLRERLVSAGLQTAREYAWERRIDMLEAFLERVAEPAGHRLSATP